jgi:hypothetical protein
MHLLRSKEGPQGAGVVSESATNRVGSWQPPQLEWRSGPIDRMRVHPPRASSDWNRKPSAAREPEFETYPRTLVG